MFANINLETFSEGSVLKPGVQLLNVCVYLFG